MASRWLAFDRQLFLATMALIAMGLIMVYSASYPDSQNRWGTNVHFITRQAIAAALGLAALVGGALIDYRRYRHPLVIGTAFLGSVGSLVLVLMLPTLNGVHRWIPVGGFNLQPSELAKLAVILFLASYLSRKDERINDLWWGLTPALSVVGVVALLIAIEPDLGTALSVMGIAAVMLWVAGLSWKLMLQLGAVGLLLATVQIVRTGYQSRRIIAYLDPWANAADAGYQTVQSLIAVGSGGWSGVGLGGSNQKLFFLPYPYTDFIYAVIGEELGLLGTGAIVLGFMVILWRGARAALRAPDRFGFYLGIGLTSFLVLQALVNMSIVLNLLPTTGIPLPFVSYGGSSMVISCATIGVLLNLSQHAHS